MLRRTFQLIPGVGPWREKDLWARGVQRWEDFPADGAPVAISAKADVSVRARLAEAEAALARRDLPALARLIPEREHWRLYSEFADQAVFFDIETDGRERLAPTVVSLLDRTGPRTFIAGRNLDALPAALAERPLWVTFNGSCFDIPVLQRHFPQLQSPKVHLDLRFICRKVRLSSGLKQIEQALGIIRPSHLRGVNGMDAVLLWRRYRSTGDVAALRFLAEYNLYDAFNLRTVLEHCWNRWLDALAFDDPRLRVFERGDVLYDVSKLLLELSPTELDLEILERLRRESGDRQIDEDLESA